MTDASGTGHGGSPEATHRPPHQGGHLALWLPIGAVGLVLLLALALLSWRLAGRGRLESSPNRRPFAAAVIRLARQPTVRYRNASGDASVAFDVGVTASGSSLGTMTIAGHEFSVLTVDGRTYVKAPASLVSSLTGSADASGLAGRWVTGGSSPALLGNATGWPWPAQYARTLLEAVNSPDAVFPSVDSEATTLDGVPALVATTPRGDLYVTKDEPHRVLRFVARGGPSGSLPPLPSRPSLPPSPSMPSMPSMPPLPSLPSAPSIPPLPSAPSGAAAGGVSPIEVAHRVGAGALTGPAEAPLAPPGGIGTMDLPPLDRADARRLLADVRKSVGELTEAIDAGVQFQLNGSADIRCSVGGCAVIAHVSNAVTTGNPDATVTGGQVNAVLTATIQIEGIAAAGCTATAPLPLGGSGDISCVSPASGAVFAQVDARKRAQAEAQSRARRGAPVPYTVQANGTALVNAVARVAVQVLVETVQREEDLLDALPEPDPDPPVTPTVSSTRSPATAPEPAPTVAPEEANPLPDEQDCLDQPPPGWYPPHGRGEGWIRNSTGPGGRAETGSACLKDVDGHATGPSGTPVGLAGAKARAVAFGLSETDVARCHTVGAQLGGSNETADGNLSPCWQNPTNTPQMRTFESDARAAARGAVLRYQVTPLYRSASSTVPEAYTMLAIATPPGADLPTWIDVSTVNNARLIDGAVRSLAD